MVNYYGIHQITNIGDGFRDMGDIRQMLIGTDNCGRFDVLQKPISATSPDYLECAQAAIQ